MKTKDNKEVSIGDRVYFAKLKRNLMYVHSIIVSDKMSMPVSECYMDKTNAHFLCIAANLF